MKKKNASVPRTSTLFGIGRAVALAGCLLVASLAATAQEHDVVILNGRVVDSETHLDAVRNVGVRDGRIAAISVFPLAGANVIDASGHVVAPGFIDLHAHGQALGNQRIQAMQGVTTVLELESGILPVADWYDPQAKLRLPLNYGVAAAWTFARISAFTGTEPEATAAYFQNAQGRDDWKKSIASPEQLEAILAGDAWPLPDNAIAHPRSNGTFAKVLRSYIRERGLLSMEEAIRKMSLMPAQTLEAFVPQMRTKGRLQIGMDADIVVFDPATIAERGTYEDPNHPAVGVQTLLVNGTPVVEGGALNVNAAPGRAIRRGTE